MIAINEFVIAAQIDEVALATWIEAGWLLPANRESVLEFSEVDLARALLIQDLIRDLGVNDEGISVTLSLVDQIHGVRRTLRDLLEAVRAQPKDTQTAILSAARSGQST